MKYQTRVDVVDAEPWFRINEPPAGVHDVKYNNYLGRWSGRLAKNNQVVYLGEWVITGENGEQRACEYDTFTSLYERVEGGQGPELG